MCVWVNVRPILFLCPYAEDILASFPGHSVSSFDCLQYVKMESKGLGERVTCMTSSRREGRHETISHYYNIWLYNEFSEIIADQNSEERIFCSNAKGPMAQLVGTADQNSEKRILDLLQCQRSNGSIGRNSWFEFRGEDLLLQCQSSNGSVDRNSWPELRRPRFNSWLEFTVYFFGIKLCR